ncbi:hypothetical protein HDU84_001054 [Entophlyctis sp. JEL0112]|nr:hypothetical protein HDU84_001054 [Entophlyctis sp. JEL0112]
MANGRRLRRSPDYAPAAAAPVPSASMAARWRTVQFVILGVTAVLVLVAIQFYEQAYAAGAANVVLLLLALVTGALGATLTQSYRVLLIAVSLFNLLLLTNVVAVSPLSQSSILLGSDVVSYYNPASSSPTPTANNTSITTTSSGTANRTLATVTSNSTLSSSLSTSTVSIDVLTTTIAAARRRDDVSTTVTSVANPTTGLNSTSGVTTTSTSTFNSTTLSSSSSSTGYSSQVSATMPVFVTIEPIIVGIQLLVLLASAIVAQFVQPDDAYTTKNDYTFSPPVYVDATSAPRKKPRGDDNPIDMTQLRAGPTSANGRGMTNIGNSNSVRPAAVVTVGAGAQRGYGDSASQSASRGPTLSTRPPRGTSAAASSAAGTANAASARNTTTAAAAPLARKYTAGPHNSGAPIAGGNAAAVRRDVYSVYTVSSDAGVGAAPAPLNNAATSANSRRTSEPDVPATHQKQQQQRIAPPASSGRGKSSLSAPQAVASAGPVDRRAPASAAPSAASDVGSSTSSSGAVRRSNSTGRAGTGGAGPRVRCRYCNEKMLASETSTHVCPPGSITNAVNDAAAGPKNENPPHAEKLDGKKVKVVKRFAATMGDELALELGDVVLVEESFEDGWALGKNREFLY